MSSISAPSTMDQATSESPVPADAMDCEDNLTKNSENETKSSPQENRLAHSMRYWMENAKKHAPKEKEQMDAQEKRESDERAALLKRYLSDRRKMECSQKGKGDGHVNFIVNHASAAIKINRKRSNDSQPARGEYRLGASVISHPIHQPQWATPYQHHAQPHHYQQIMMQKMHNNQRIMEMQMQLNNGANTKQNGLNGGNGMINSNGMNAAVSSHPTASFPHYQQIMHHQPQQNMAHYNVQMLGRPTNNLECASLPGYPHNATHLSIATAPFHYHASQHQQTTLPPLGGDIFTVASSNDLSNRMPSANNVTATSIAMDAGKQVDDNALQFFASETANVCLQDLGPDDLFVDSDGTTDHNEITASSVGQVQEQNSVHSGQNSFLQNEFNSAGCSLADTSFHQTLSGSGPLSSNSDHSQSSTMQMNPQMSMHMVASDLQRQQYVLQQQNQRTSAAQQMYHRAAIPATSFAPQPMMQQSQTMLHPQMNQHSYSEAVMNPQEMMRTQLAGSLEPSISYSAHSGTSTTDQSPMFSQFPVH